MQGIDEIVALCRNKSRWDAQKGRASLVEPCVSNVRKPSRTWVRAPISGQPFGGDLAQLYLRGYVYLNRHEVGWQEVNVGVNEYLQAGEGK